MKTPQQSHWRRAGVLTVKFEHVSYLFLKFLLLILKRKMFSGMKASDRKYFGQNHMTEFFMKVKIHWEKIINSYCLRKFSSDEVIL